MVEAWGLTALLTITVLVAVRWHGRVWAAAWGHTRMGWRNTGWKARANGFRRGWRH